MFKSMVIEYHANVEVNFAVDLDDNRTPSFWIVGDVDNGCCMHSFKQTSEFIQFLFISCSNNSVQ